MQRLGGGRPAAGAVVTLQSVGRPGCASYAAAAPAQGAGAAVQLTAGPQAFGVHWELHAGLQPGTFYLASAACPTCAHRWLGAGCADGTLRLHARPGPQGNAAGRNGTVDSLDSPPLLLWRLAL